MIQVRRLGHATLTTPDLEKQVDYYSEVVGLTLLEKTRDRAILATKTGLEAIELEQAGEAGLKRLAFQVAPDSDLGELAANLQKEGIKSERRSGISPCAGDAIHFVDDKGTEIDVYAEYKFPEQEDRRPSAITPVKLGHVAYRVLDAQKTTKFYTELLGFRVSDWRGNFFAFLRCGVDHHTVNFVNDPKPQLHHIAFEVKDWPEIHRACEWLAKNGIPLVWGPGRHIIGHNIACYHRNPDGLRVEFFTEMDQMKDETLGYFDPRPWHQDRPQRPKNWGPETMRNYWGFGSERNYPGYP